MNSRLPDVFNPFLRRYLTFPRMIPLVGHNHILTLTYSPHCRGHQRSLLCSWIHSRPRERLPYYDIRQGMVLHE